MPSEAIRPHHTTEKNARFTAILLAAMLGACGTDVPSVTHSVAIPEDTSFSDILVGGSKIAYHVAVPPVHGEVRLDATSGAFSYQPARNYSGPDSFTFVGEYQAWATSTTVLIVVTPVNDPPDLPPLNALANSPESREVAIALPTHDVDGEVLTYEIAVSDPSVATTHFESSTGILTVTQGARGQAEIGIAVTDGVFNVVGTLNYTVTAQTKRRVLSTGAPRAEAVQITNTGPQAITLTLRHNQATLHTSTAQIIEDIEHLSEETVGETFGRKLWRYIRDGTNHFYPITATYAQHDPLLLIESFGWGFCGDVAAAYVSLAREAGAAARGWGLQGHVVPEILEHGQWRLYDPDLGVYYNDVRGEVAGVVQLADDPTLITAPIDPILGEAGGQWQYGGVVASIYETTSNNIVLADDYFLAGRFYPEVELPPGARFTYPGRWRANPVGMEGQKAFEVIVHAQLKLDLPPGFMGIVDLPLVLWDVEGVGRIRIGGVDYLPGDAELTAALQSLAIAPQSVEIVTSQSLSLYYLINPNRFNMDWTNEVEVTSPDAWAADVSFVPLPAVNRLQF